MNHERFEFVDGGAGSDELVASRYRHSARLGERVRWLPPHRLVPSFASADGQSAVYRRRSQIVLAENSDNSAITHATTFGFGASGELKVRIDEHGFARVVRPARAQQHVDPLTHLSDSASHTEREAAEAVCQHLNQHVDAIALPHRWTPSPAVQLVPLARRAFQEAAPEQPSGPKDASGGQRVALNVVNEYLDARAAWLKRRFAWENTQRAVLECGERAAAGDPAAMQEHLIACLNDVLWPTPVAINYRLDASREARLDVEVPGLEALPDRVATVTYGNRVVVQPMMDVKRTMLHNRNAMGLLVRLLGEIFAALPSIERVAVSGFQRVAGKPRYVLSAATERKTWSMLYAEGWITAEAAERALKGLGARYSVSGLGALLPVEPFG